MAAFLRRKTGQGAIETLFVVLILALLFFGAVEMGRGVLLKHALDVGSEKAARMLSINPADFSTAEWAIRTEVDANLLGSGYGSQVVVRLYDAGTLVTITPAELAAAPFGYRFLVGVELAYQADVPFSASRGGR